MKDESKILAHVIGPNRSARISLLHRLNQIVSKGKIVKVFSLCEANSALTKNEINTQIKTIIIPVREIKSLHYSNFFKNIINEYFPSKFSESPFDVVNSCTNEIVRHFNTQNMDVYTYFNYEFIFDQLNMLYDIKITNNVINDMVENKEYLVINLPNGVRIGFFNIYFMDDYDSLKTFLKKLKIKTSKPKFGMDYTSYNVANTSNNYVHSDRIYTNDDGDNIWYSKKYVDFLRHIND
jgi:hypothetical protein